MGAPSLGGGGGDSIWMQRRGAESRVAIWNVSHDDSLSFRNLSHGNGGVAMMGSPVAASIVASDACVDDELLCSNITRAERVFMNQLMPHNRAAGLISHANIC